MAEYRVEITRPASKELEDLGPRAGRGLLASIEALASHPRPRQCRKLTGSEDSYRLRVGVYRVLYQIDDEDKKIIVYAVGHRRDIYR